MEYCISCIDPNNLRLVGVVLVGVGTLSFMHFIMGIIDMMFSRNFSGVNIALTMLTLPTSGLLLAGFTILPYTTSESIGLFWSIFGATIIGWVAIGLIVNLTLYLIIIQFNKCLQEKYDRSAPDVFGWSGTDFAIGPLYLLLISIYWIGSIEQFVLSKNWALRYKVFVDNHVFG